MLSGDRGKSVRERGRKRKKQELKEGPIFLLCWSCAGKTPVVWMFSSALYSGCFAFHMCSATSNPSPVHQSVHPFAHEVSIVFHVSALFQEKRGWLIAHLVMYRVGVCALNIKNKIDPSTSKKKKICGVTVISHSNVHPPFHFPSSSECCEWYLLRDPHNFLAVPAWLSSLDKLALELQANLDSVERVGEEDGHRRGQSRDGKVFELGQFLLPRLQVGRGGRG